MNKDSKIFRETAHQFVDWMADYMENVEQYPVKSQVAPKDIYNQIENAIPYEGESLEAIFDDFKKIIVPGITHWQSPNFFAYFQANTSTPSILAEMLTATLGIQGMKWDTSPASTELEEKVMEWLRDAITLPSNWSGVIQDSASTATLASIITAREQKSKFEVNKKGFKGYTNFRVYCSEETHSSIEKAVKIAGIGKENLVKVPTDATLAMDAEVLATYINRDLANGHIPLCVIAAIGTTGSMAMDPLATIAEITKKHKLWLHVDAAYAGAAFLLPEYQYLMKGITDADSLVFNPHKWLFTNFDCTAYFIKDKDALVNTFSILPEYLKTKTDGLVANHCDWGIPLGRRFRSLKLWFVLRHYGLKGLQEKLRYHIKLSKWLEAEITNSTEFELAVPRSMNLVCFYYKPPILEHMPLEAHNRLNEKLLNALNRSGNMYLTHTKIEKRFVLRMSIGQTNVAESHIQDAWSFIKKTAKDLLP